MISKTTKSAQKGCQKYKARGIFLKLFLNFNTSENLIFFRNLTSLIIIRDSQRKNQFCLAGRAEKTAQPLH